MRGDSDDATLARIAALESGFRTVQDQIRAMYRYCIAATVAIVVLFGLVAALAHLSGVAP